MPADETWTHTALAQQIVFGAGALGRLPDLLNALGLRSRAARDHRRPGGERRRSAGGAGHRSEPHVDVRPGRVHVPVPLVQEALRQARRDGVDGIVSFGGGSCADLGKAVAFFTEQEQGVPVDEFADRPVLPHVAIPTTYSGAELTPLFGMTDPVDQAEERRGRSDLGAGGRGLRPGAHPRHPTAGQRRDRHERAGPLRGGGVVAAIARPRPRPSRSRQSVASPTPCRGGRRRPDDRRRAHRHARRRRARRPVPAERGDGHPPRPVADGRRPQRHPARPGQRA